MSDQYYKDTKRAISKFEDIFNTLRNYLSDDVKTLYDDVYGELELLLFEYDNNLEIINQLEEDKMQLNYKVESLEDTYQDALKLLEGE